MQDVKQDKMYRFLAVLTVAAYVGSQGWQTLFNNFAVEIGGLEGNQIGMIQSVREIPGFLSLLAIFFLLFMREHRLSVLSILLLGIGIGATGFFPGYWGILMTTVVMSVGFHYYETTNQSLTLQYFRKDTSPWVFGRLRSLAAVSNIGVGLFILLVSKFLDYLTIYLLVGLFILILGVWGLRQDPTRADQVIQRKRMIFRWKYRLFYFLTFMAGARRQIFVAFAVFLMVKKFQFTIQEITLLFIINNAVNYFLSPGIGRAVIRYGERKVLSLEYFSLIFIFTAYPLVESKWIIAILYILDHIFFNFSFAIRTYFQKIGDERDIAPSMAMGFTINHIAAVVIPAVGGFLWMVDYRIPFFAGAAMSFISLMASQMIRTPEESIQ